MGSSSMPAHPDLVVIAAQLAGALSWVRAVGLRCAGFSRQAEACVPRPGFVCVPLARAFAASCAEPMALDACQFTLAASAYGKLRQMGRAPRLTARAEGQAPRHPPRPDAREGV